MNKKPENKEIMEKVFKSNKIDGTNGKMINGDNTETITYNTYNIFYPEVTTKNEYSEIYYKYVNKFEELEGYLFSNLFWNYQKEKYNFKSVSLQVGKAIIDWAIGKKDFPIQLLEQFQNELKSEFDINEDEIIKKRWVAMLEYFRGNIESSITIYQELLIKIKSGEQIESYFKDDILIDGRNINAQYDNENNRYKLNDEFQEEINKNRHILANPIYDRIKTNIYEAAHKNSFGYKHKSKHTIIYSNRLESICNDIQKLIYVTIFYGSITHLKLSRELLSDILYLYADALGDEDLYLSSLRMLLLSNNTKKFEQLFNSLKCKMPKIYSNEFINSLLNQRNTVIKFYIDNYNCFLYKLFGKYLLDEEYLELENMMLSEIEINDKININNIYNILKALKTNVSRIANKEKLFQIFLSYFENEYSRFYIEISEIINIIEIELLDKNEKELFEKILDKLAAKRKEYSLNIIDAMVNYKKITKSNKYDEIIYENAHNIIVNNIIEEKNNYDTVKKIIDIMEERENEREKNPGLFTGYANEYTIGRNSFSKENYTRNLEELILTRYIPLARRILNSKNQTIYEKIRHIKMLSNLLIENNTEKYRNIILGIVDKINFESVYDDEFRNRTIEDLNNNKKMLEFLLGIISQEKMINTFCEAIFNNEDNILEVLKCFNCINEKIELKDTNLENQLYFTFLYAYNKDYDIDVKCKSYSILKILLKSKYKINMIELINNNANVCTFEEAREIIKVLLYEKIENQYIKEIKEKLLKNNNYNIRRITNRYLTK